MTKDKTKINEFVKNIRNDNKESVIEAIKDGTVDLEQTTDTGEHPLHICISENKMWALGLILMNGKTKTQDEYQELAEYAISFTNVEALDKIEKTAGKINYKSEKVSELLFDLRNFKGWEGAKLMKFIIDKKIDHNYINDENQSLLLKIMKNIVPGSSSSYNYNINDWTKIICELVTHKSQINIIDKNNDNPIYQFNKLLKDDYYELESTHRSYSLSDYSEQMRLSLLKSLEMSKIPSQDVIMLLDVNNSTHCKEMIYYGSFEAGEKIKKKIIDKRYNTLTKNIKNIDALDSNSEYLAMSAVRMGNFDLFERFCKQSKANVSIKNKQNQNCEDLAKELGQFDIYTYIQSMNKKQKGKRLSAFEFN